MPRGRAGALGRWMMRAPGKLGGAIVRGAGNIGNALRVLGRTGNPAGGGGGAGGAPAGTTPTPNQGQIDAALAALMNDPATFLQNNILQTAGQTNNGLVPVHFQPMNGVQDGTQKDEGGQPWWQLQRPPAGSAPGVSAYNFKLNAMKDLLGTGDEHKKDPEFLTIPHDAADALVYTGQLTGCTIGAFQMPNGDLKIVHLMPRKTAERPATPTGMTQQDAENQAMRDIVLQYKDDHGGTNPVHFYQSGTASTPTTYPKSQLKGVYIAGHVKDGVLHLFAQEIPLDSSQPVVVTEILTIRLR